MKLKLPASMYSVDQVLSVAEELHQYGRRLGRKHQPRDSQPLSDEASDALKSLSPAEREQADSIELLRSELEELASSAAAITLVVAAPPSAKLKLELAEWLRTNLNPHVLVNFHVNPEIGGGVMIRSTNHVYDCSYRTRLLRHQANFTKVLERV